MAVSEKPDLIIIDTILPDTVGFDVCARIKERLGDACPSIIIQTGSIDAVDAVRAKQVGANDYCVKTIDCSPLLEAMKNLNDE